ncbi:probable aldehyde oxidase gad-3 [Bicyclus anynana]|uniref:Probable aldehyde oxidase gad-3 n=1 Tax=Bicyclus anynana TaxID=110368 RepID=A0ABM3LSN7_BICAN|nr:probable aldehyde oxidase gad-3 [Bicyclus anynana]
MSQVTFTVNGSPQCVGSEVSSTTTLLDYLRNTLNLRGTKYMCLEGGCGACIVSATKCHGDTPQGVNSCMVSITSCQDWDIQTIEKVGNRLDGYHPLQKTLAENNGSQCGYCSPGMVMNMYSLMKTRRLTMLEIEKSLASNVCRCTGYRPILDAFKKFASDAPNTLDIKDIEDLKICEKGNCSEDCDDYDWCVVPRHEVISETLHIRLRDNRDWFRVYTLTDIFIIWQSKGAQSYMLVAGNTGKGVYPILEYPKILIDVSFVSELKSYYMDQNLVIGAGNTLTDLINILEIVGNADNFNYLKVINQHLALVAHVTVRNLGTVAGNLMLKHRYRDFKSDIFLLLETVGAQLRVMIAPGRHKFLTMQGFLQEDMTRKIIVSVLLPPYTNDHKLVTYKIMPRAQNAHALIHAGFIYRLDSSNRVIGCRIVYGGLSPTFIRAYNTEKYLYGKNLFTNETLRGAINALKNEMVVTESLPDPPVEYRRKVALGLFYKGLLSLMPPSIILSSRIASGAVKLNETRPVSEGRQIFDTNPTLWPLNKPIPKLEALIQCAGETTYTEDLPTLPKEVFAAFTLTTVALGTIDKIDISKALKEPGVIAFYTAADIPGVNSFTPAVNLFNSSNEEFLCDGQVKYYNQPYGIIVAETQSIAQKAASLVQVTYSNVKKPVTDIKVSKKDPSKATLFKTKEATRTGTEVTNTIKGENSFYWQYHFSMETLVCVTHPTEEGLKVYSATQWIHAVQTMVQRVLKLNQSSVDVFVRRLGGSYGYKLSRVTQVSVACSLVSHKLNRPCRFIQSLTNNMRAVGKREPCSANFEIRVNKKGVIQYVDYEFYLDNGYTVNELVIMIGFDVFNNCYNNDTWNYKAYNALTDTPSNTWCRSPGTLANIAMAEIILERICYELDLDPFEVRLANLDTVNYNDLLEMAETIKTSSQYAERKAAVKKFNSENRWKKRGLRPSFLRWTPFGYQYFEVNMSVYNDDGTVVITPAGVEMGQGVNTKATQVCAYFLKIPLEKIQIKPNDTINAPNGFPSGGSLTSQNVSIGIRRCCEELLRRLEPVRSQLTDPTWEELIKKAYEMEVDLQVHSLVNSKDVQNYHIYGIALAEVEVDGLTGEWQFIRADIHEDTGRSVNPELDVGQVEGGFIMGCGYWTYENLVYEPNSGELLTNRTWEYWVPQARDIPQDFRVSFRKRSYSTELILGAKGVGEPATCMGIVVSFALRAAIAAMRLESGIPTKQWFQLDGPFTVDKIAVACAVNADDFKFY